MSDQLEHIGIFKKEICKKYIKIEYFKVMWYQDLYYKSKLILELCMGSCKQTHPIVLTYSSEYDGIDLYALH